MYAIFALKEQVGGRGTPSLESWILNDDERWHDVVRGDGGSYRSGGPDDMQAKPNETKKAFTARVEATVKRWERENA